MRIDLFPSLGLTNFGVLGVCSVERWRAIRGSLLSVSADAVITCLFMPCVSRFIITSRKLTCTFSLCENSEHKRFLSTFTGTKHSLFFFFFYCYFVPTQVEAWFSNTKCTRSTASDDLQVSLIFIETLSSAISSVVKVTLCTIVYRYFGLATLSSVRDKVIFHFCHDFLESIDSDR